MFNGHKFSLSGAQLTARASGVLWWEEQRLLCVSDLHFGKSDRLARRFGVFVPPYETADTLRRLQAEIEALDPTIIICLGDSFDDLEASKNLKPEDRRSLHQLQEGRKWFWIEGNHDPGLVELSGEHLKHYKTGPLIFRHIAELGSYSEVSGHYHPKAAVRLSHKSVVRPCFLYDDKRLILPAFGTFTGGLKSDAKEFDGLMNKEAYAVLTGDKSYIIPMPRK